MWRWRFAWPGTLHLQGPALKLHLVTLVSYWLGCVFWHFRWFDDTFGLFESYRTALWCVFLKLPINKASVREENSRTDALLPSHLYVLTSGKIIKSAEPLAGEQLGGWNDFFWLLNTWINQHTLNINMNLIPPFIFLLVLLHCIPSITYAY